MMIFVIVFPILAGWLGGWLINYLADTLPLTHRLTRPACKQCGQEYSAGVYLSFRPCQNCGHHRGLRPWFVQAAMMAIGLYTWFNPHRMGYALGMVLITYYAVVVVIDMEHRLILHPTSIAGALLGLGLGTWLHGPASRDLIGRHRRDLINPLPDGRQKIWKRSPDGVYALRSLFYRQRIFYYVCPKLDYRRNTQIR
ncbi:MAG: hypothetical protein HYR93_04420 [Chloroflexi bacterium]|nr:hypothetical protein [Chloroflexota bacterium]